MDDILDDLERQARRCERAALTFESDDLSTTQRNLSEAINSVANSWSGSWLGYQANVYLQNLRPRMPGEYFDTQFGDSSFTQTVGPWCEYTYEAVLQHIRHLANVHDEKNINQAADEARDVFDDVKSELLPTLDALLSSSNDQVIRDLREKANTLKSHLSANDFVNVRRPTGRFMTSDQRVISGGMQTPPHIYVEAWVLSQYSYASQLLQLAGVARHALRYLQKSLKMKGKTVAKTDGKIFIGHGRSPAWRDLKDFLQDRLKLTWEEFNSDPTAGRSTKERLLELMDQACFAFLVMTAEDELDDGTKQARANVIHEAGLFQGRLGFERAIILLEDGCEEFSNIVGLTQIRFPKDKIKSEFEEIRRVLERENIIK